MAGTRPQVIIQADAPDALTELCGVSLLERLLRILRRLEFDQALIASSTPNEIRAAIERPTWARKGLAVRIVFPNEVRFALEERILLLPGNFYCDARLTRTLSESDNNVALVDSNPPEFVRPLLAGCERSPRGFISGAALIANSEADSLKTRIEDGTIGTIDAAAVPSYIIGMRRHIRPVFFPSPPSELRRDAERLILDTSQNGTLDIPAIFHSPIETWIMRWLCRTSITPNQITVFGLCVGFSASGFFASGQLWWGMVLALLLGVIDGLDGKQARVKIETTETGKWEHTLDFFLETSWWAALAFWFWRSGQLPNAWLWFGLITIAGVFDQLAKSAARIRAGRLLDDLTPFDQFVRRIGARRNIYIWALAIGLALGVPARTFELCAWWGAITAAVHVVRAVMITARAGR